MKSKICILSFSNIAWDARVLREIEAANGRYQVDVIGYGNWSHREDIRFFSLPRPERSLRSWILKGISLALGKFHPILLEFHYWQRLEYQSALKILLREKYDLIHANDWDALPVAGRAARQVGSRVLFDAHEYTPAQAADVWRRRWVDIPLRISLLRAYQNCATRMITVSEGLRDLYHANFGWSPEVILNAPHYVKSPFRPTQEDRIELVHHGGASRKRHLEDLVQIAGLLDERFKLNFVLLTSEPGYLRYLKTLARQKAPGKVAFHDPVPPQMITQELVKYDLGVPWLQTHNLNHLNALPNKFFDYIMAGLAIAIPPLPSMQNIVETHKIGVVAADQTVPAMAKALNELTPETINRFKKHSLELAKSFNAEVEMGKLMRIYAEVLGT